MYGDVIKPEFRGKVFEGTGSQADVAATLLAQLNLNAKDFRWSKNLLNPYVKPFAFFSWDNGMGFIDNQQCITFNNIGKAVLYNSKEGDPSATANKTNTAKAYLQLVYEDFLKL